MSAKRTSPKSQAVIAPASAETYQLKPKEKVSIDAHLGRRARAKPFPRQVVETVDGAASLTDDHPDKAVGASLTMEALGLTRVGELTSILQHVVDLTQRDRRPDEHAINEMLAHIAAVQPADGVEAMLAVQMAAVHRAVLKAARALRGSETIPQQDSNSNSFNKLARTFVGQVDALKRYRSKGEQKVIVEHVTVNDGGQAIVGQVGGGGRYEK